MTNVLQELHLIEGIPSGKVPRGTKEFAELEAVARTILKRVFGKGVAKTRFGRWWQNRKLGGQNQYLAQYGWNVGPDGELFEVPVQRIVWQMPEEQQPTAGNDIPVNPWHTGRIQIKSGYVVDTHDDNQIIHPSEMYEMKARLG